MKLEEIEFTKEELKEIISRGLNLVTHGYITALNLIHSDQNLPTNAIILHYLQDSQDQMSFVLKELDKRGMLSEHLLVPRLTFYKLDPQYVQKKNFKQEYQNAIFRDKELNIVSIEDVIEYPKNKIVDIEELDLILPSNGEDPLINLVKILQVVDSSGPEQWIHPAIIVKSDSEIAKIPEFIQKDYVSLSKTHSEFYSIVSDSTRLSYLEKYLDKICEELKTSQGFNLRRNSVLVFPSQINKEFSEYIDENQDDLEPV